MIAVCGFQILSMISFANELYANTVERTFQKAPQRVMRKVGSLENREIGPGVLSRKLLEEPITRGVLVDLKTRGLRRRLWYSTLSRLERGLVDLTIRWVDKVRSGRMTETLVRILAKLAQALETGMGKVLGKGRILAARASELAVKWGNVSAYSWRYEHGFCRAIGLGIVGLS